MPDPLSLARLPLQLGLRAGGVALQVGVGIVRRAASLVGGGEASVTVEQPPAPSPPPARVPISSRATKPQRGRKRAAAPPPPSEDHVSEEPVQVASFAEPGAEETPGPQIEIAEPWDEYDRMKAREVQHELASAGREVAAAVVLYEAAKRGRRTVVAAAERRLAALDAAARP